MLAIAASCCRRWAVSEFCSGGFHDESRRFDVGRDEINAIVASPSVKSRIEAMGEIVRGGTPEAAAVRIKGDYDRYGAIVERLKIVGE